MKTLNPNKTYPQKVYKGQVISDDRFIHRLYNEDMTADQEKKRAKLIQVCEDAGIELSLGEPYNLTWEERITPAHQLGEYLIPESIEPESHQIRSTFYLIGNYPEWYFYQTVNQVYAMPLSQQ